MYPDVVRREVRGGREGEDRGRRVAGLTLLLSSVSNALSVLTGGLSGREGRCGGGTFL